MKTEKKKIWLFFFPIIFFSSVFFADISSVEAGWLEDLVDKIVAKHLEMKLKYSDDEIERALAVGGPGGNTQTTKELDEVTKLGISGFFLKMAGDFLDYMIEEAVIKIFQAPGPTAAVGEAWAFVRDFLNLFYVLILVFLGISTILGVGKYRDKKLVFQVVLSALLVNFSLPIAYFIIDLSNLAMLYFADVLKGDNTSYADAFIDATNLAGIIDKHANIFSIAGWANMFKGGVMALMEFIAVMVLAIMLFFLAVSLLIRLIAFWVLIILSPFAFFGLALPDFRGMTTDWVNKITAYSVYAPIMLFFMLVAVVMASAVKNGVKVALENGDSVSMLNVLLPYITAVYIIFYGYEKAMSWAQKAGTGLSGVMGKGRGMAMAAIGGFGLGKAVTGGVKGVAGATTRGLLSRTQAATGLNFLTKKGREDNLKKLEMMAAGKGADYEREKVLEKVKKNEEEGGDTLEGYLKTINDGKKKSIDRKAAAVSLAKMGGLDSPETVRKAMELFGGDKKSQNKLSEMIRTDFEKKAKEGDVDTEEKMQAMMKVLLDGSLLSGDNTETVSRVKRMVGKERKDLLLGHEIGEAVAQAQKVAGIDEGDIAQVENAAKEINEMIKTNTVLKTLVEKIKESNGGRDLSGLELVRSLKNKKDHIEGQAWNAMVEKMSFNDITNQKSDEFFKRNEVVTRLRQVSRDKTEDKLRGDLSNHLDSHKMAILERSLFAPTGQSSATSDSTSFGI